MTLPLIFALNSSDWLERKKIIFIVRNQSEKPEKVREVIDFVKRKGGLDYATNVMTKFANQAISLLDGLPNYLAREHLKGLVEFTINEKIKETELSKFRKLEMNELQRLSPSQFSKKEKNPLVFVLDGIRSLNNVGSVFRTADAFGIMKIYLCGLTGQPPHRDIQKTALGATETVGWSYFSEISECLKMLKKQGFIIVGIEQTTDCEPLHHFQNKPNQKLALIFGNEVTGISDKVSCSFVIKFWKYLNLEPNIHSMWQLQLALFPGM